MFSFLLVKMSEYAMSCVDLISSIHEGKVRVGDFSDRMKLAPITVENKKLILQTPQMKSLFGANPAYNPNASKMQGVVEANPNTNYTMDLSFENEEKRKSLRIFREVLELLADLVIKKAISRSQKWFGKQLEENVIKEMFKPNIRNGNEKYPPSFRLTLHRQDGKFAFEVCDKDYNNVNLEEIITRNANITSIIKCSGVWIIGKTFGISFRIEQLLVVPPVVNNDIVFREDSDTLMTDELKETIEKEQEQEVKKETKEGNVDHFNPMYEDETPDNCWGSKKKDPMKMN